jgi:hypothetical protein
MAQIFFTVGLILGIAYFLYKLVRIWQQASSVYLNVSKSLTLFDILSILSLIGCIAWGALVWRDFGKGLKGAGELVALGLALLASDSPLALGCDRADPFVSAEQSERIAHNPNRLAEDQVGDGRSHRERVERGAQASEH